MATDDDKPNVWNFKDSLHHLLAGALAGLVADSSTHPIDTVRARLQVQVRSKCGRFDKREERNIRLLAVWNQPSNKAFDIHGLQHSSSVVYTSTVDVFRKMLKSEGLRGFYKGFAIGLH